MIVELNYFTVSSEKERSVTSVGRALIRAPGFVGWTCKDKGQNGGSGI